MGNALAPTACSRRSRRYARAERVGRARNRSSTGWVFWDPRVGLYAHPTGRKSPSRGCGPEWPPLLTVQGPPSAPRARSASPLCAVCEILVYATLRYANAEAEGRYRVPNQNGLDGPVSTVHKPRSDSGALPAAKFSQTLTARFRVPSIGRGSVSRAVLYSSNPALGGLREKL